MVLRIGGPSGSVRRSSPAGPAGARPGQGRTRSSRPVTRTAQPGAVPCRWEDVTVPASRAPWPGADPEDAPAGSADLALARMRRVVHAQRDIASADAVPATVFQVLAESVITIFPAEGAIASEPEGDF